MKNKSLRVFLAGLVLVFSSAAGVAYGLDRGAEAPKDVVGFMCPPYC